MKRAFTLLSIVAVAVLFSAEAVVAQTPPEDEQTVAATVTRGGQQVQTRVLRQVPNPDGPGNDTLDGGPRTDTCTTGETVSNCELP